MFKWVGKLYNNLSDKGIKFPFAYDPITKGPSVMLLFAYITFVFMMLSLIGLHIYKQILQATLVSIVVWVLAVVFYRLRELDKVKIDIKNQSIDLEDLPDVKEKDKDDENTPN